MRACTLSKVAVCPALLSISSVCSAALAAVVALNPVIEAVMVGQRGNAGISSTALGRPLPKASAALQDAEQ
jgi:hypothetical protein